MNNMKDSIKNYRIIKIKTGNEVNIHVQIRFLFFFWTYIVEENNIKAYFESEEEAREYINIRIARRIRIKEIIYL